MKSEKNEVKSLNSARIARNLETAGMDGPLASAVADALHETTDYVLSRTVSREEFAEFKGDMHKDMSDFKGEMRKGMSDFKAEIQKELRLYLAATLGGVFTLLAFFT